MRTWRKLSGLLAGIALMAFGAMLVVHLPIIGVMTVICGFFFTLYQIVLLRQGDADPYDLRRLWDTPPPDEEDPDDIPSSPNDPLYCHHCGCAVPSHLHRCPECGNRLG
jgi:hypothetical protein